MNSVLALLYLLVSATCGSNLPTQLPGVHGDGFYYFGYGSNMLAKRIHIQNPTAKFVGPVELKDYRLDFATINSGRWDGAVATIVPTKDALTWGTLWNIDLKNLVDIDNQEGVHENFYRPISVHVKFNNGTEIIGRSYVLVNQPESIVHDSPESVVPEDRKPSKTYLQVLVKGAIESGLPQDYVNWLKKIKHNNRTVKHFEQSLELESVELF